MSTGTGSSIGALRVHFCVEEEEDDVYGEVLLRRRLRLRVCGLLDSIVGLGYVGLGYVLLFVVLLGDLTITTENDCDCERFFGTAYIVVI